jgi:hypothetical protein
MHNIFFPTTIVDGFLDNPDALRKFALEQDFYRDDSGRWPGSRTTTLSTLSPVVYNQICQKLLALFFTAEQTYSYNIESSFQLVNKNYNAGWVHKDPSIITAMLYLTPESYSGTSLYLKKNISYDDRSSTVDKMESYKIESDNVKARNLHNQNYEEILNAKGLYNRLLVFDSNNYHAAHDFFGSSKEDSRLTLVSFVHGLIGDYRAPLQRSKSVEGNTTL